MPRIVVVDDDTTLLEPMADIVRESLWEMFPVQDCQTLSAYRVLVINEATGVQQEVSVQAHGTKDAQVGALHAMFLDHAWRHASARVPHTVLESV